MFDETAAGAAVAASIVLEVAVSFGAEAAVGSPEAFAVTVEVAVAVVAVYASDANDAGRSSMGVLRAAAAEEVGLVALLWLAVPVLASGVVLAVAAALAE